MKNNTKKIIITTIAIIILLVILLPKFISSSSVEKTNGTGNSADMVISVKAHIIQPETLDNKVLTTGTILANEEVELTSEISGKITRILFKEGSYVNKGDLLIKINDSDLQAQLRSAESKVKLSEEKEFRQRQLRDGNLISQEEYDNTLGELNVNKANYDLIKSQIDKTEIRAPFSGVVGLRSVSEGSYVTSLNVMAKLQNLSSLKVDFSIPERYSSYVKTGDEIDFKVSGSSTLFKAKVYAIEPKIDPGTRTLKIRALCSSYYSELIPGAFANVELNLKQINNAILIPTVSIVPELKGQRVFVYKNGYVVPQNVEIGIREETRVQIVTGLSAGDTILTSGILQVRPKSKVSISEFN